MKIGVFSGSNDINSLSTYEEEVINYLKANNIIIYLDNRLKDILRSNNFKLLNDVKDIDVLFTIGGDGTLLRAIPFIKNSKVPILGINTGQLGFLTSLNKELLIEGLEMFFKKQYVLIKRSLIRVNLKPENPEIISFPYALNEVSINRKNTSSMLSIKTIIDKNLLTTYWSDGLIISTPTGSTGYSLSSGGPILSPDTKVTILNPIAPHNISIRPLIVRDTSEIEIKVTGRSKDQLIFLDNRKFSIPNGCSIKISKASFCINTIQLDGNDFFKTLRNKLFWGIDMRNRQ
ncbi:MAG: NAD(+) kinase [Flavobacteriaceae bacterium]|jgi:NAD+ kinase|nr:NAD(+) kinase [Flavobacteriaceae bacterium]|tara:strand:- start:3077 stop:3943 length:867 start_codon:yes stop_codon:yes gene_type:complete